MGGGGGPSKEEIAAQERENRMMMQEMEAQRNASLQMANQNMAMGFANAQMQANAAIQSSRNSMMGGILSSAIAANKETVERKQMLPSEIQAEFMRSYEMAAQWDKTLEMKMQGYQNVAIQYELSGKNFKPLFKDSQWNALEMARLTRKDIETGAKIFGIQSDKNPSGVPISQAYWLKMHSMKNPSEMLEVDPQVAQQRMAAYNSWKEHMRANGYGLAVDIYENPQLGGESILTMKGKDPLIDPRLAPLLKETLKPQPQPDIYMPNFQTPGPNMNQINHEINHYTELQKQGKGGKKVQGMSFTVNERLAELIAERDRANAQASANAHNNAEMRKMMESTKMPADTTDWDAVVRALTTGEQNKYTDEIKRYMTEGLIDKYGMVNADKLLSMVPKELREPPEFNMFRELSPQERAALLDQYDQYASMVVDPKLISEKVVAPGAVRRVKLNADGSVAHQAMEGEIYDAMGNPIWVQVQGGRLQDLYDRMSMIDGMGPTFPGMMAPVTQEELQGTFEPGFWGSNQLASARESGGQKRTAAQISQQQPQMATFGGASPGVQSKPAAMPGADGAEQKPAPQVTTLGANETSQTNKPAGYDGAPLAAGGE